MLLVFVLCGVAFGFAQHTKQHPLEVQRLFAGTAASLFLGLIAYFLLSIASLGMTIIWFGFRSASISLPALSPGPIYRVNALAVLALTISLVLLALKQITREGIIAKEQESLDPWASPRLNDDASMPVAPSSFLSISQVAILLIFGLIALLFGLSSLINGVVQAAK